MSEFIGIKFMGLKRSGSSLVEMIMAIVIMAVVLLGLASAMVVFRGTLVTKEDAVARRIALSELEKLESVKLTEIQAKVPKSPQGIYTVTKTVAPGAINATTPSASVTITVTWNDGSKSVALKREVSSSGWQNVGTLP